MKIKTIAMFCFFLSVCSQIESRNYYFGDIHNHSTLSDGNTIPSKVYEFARDSTKLDFFCLTDHDEYPANNTNNWNKMISLANIYNQKNKFVTLFGYEYTSFIYKIGHRIIIYPNESGMMFVATKVPLNELYNKVKQQGGIINIAHPNAVPYASAITNSEIEDNIEICNGDFIYEFQESLNAYPSQLIGSSVQDWLKNGKTLGFLGVSDSHNGKPGESGLTGVYCDSLTRSCVFSAILNRNTFAVSRGEKVKLKFCYMNYIMGNVVNEFAAQKKFYYEIYGTDSLKKIEIVCNNKVIEILHDQNKSTSGSLLVSDDFANSFYYLRVTQKNGTMAWTSPIFFKTKSGINDEKELNKFYLNKIKIVDENKLIIELNNPLNEICSVSLNDTFGRNIFFENKINTNESQIELNLGIHKIPLGAYILNFKSSKLNFNHKFFFK